jgi:hypothetical protein
MGHPRMDIPQTQATLGTTHRTKKKNKTKKKTEQEKTKQSQHGSHQKYWQN